MDVLALSRRIPLLGFFGSSASDDDFADRLNYKYTVAILVIFAFIVTNKHFGHNQINCWVPALFSKNFEEYTNLVCWITNTYYIPFDKQIPNNESERRHTELRYYQWVAYILLFLSLLFYLPRIIWRTLGLRSGIDIKDVVEASHDFKSVSKLEKNRKMMEYMIGTIDQYVDDPRRQRASRNMNIFRRTIALSCFMFGKFLGNYLVILYLFVKILYIANCIGQLFLISILLGRNYYIYGASIFRDIIQGKGYADSEYFPRVTMCKFQVRELGLKNFSHEYNVQCVLPINLFNQQIFTFLWFWYLILLIINTSALLIWIYRFIPINQYNYAIRRIKLLRIRLIENSKLSNKKSKKTNLKYQQTVISNEVNQTHSTKHPMKPQDRDKDYLFDDEKEEMSEVLGENRNFGQYITKSYHNSEQPIFPNIPPNFEFNSRGSMKLRNRKKNLNENHDDNVSNISTSTILEDFESYMTASSFSVKNYKAFVYEYLEADGMFMIRMIGSNSGDFVCTQVLHNLWKLFLCKQTTLSQVRERTTSNIDDRDENENDDYENDEVKRLNRMYRNDLKTKRKNLISKLFKENNKSPSFIKSNKIKRVYQQQDSFRDNDDYDQQIKRFQLAGQMKRNTNKIKFKNNVT